MTLQGWRELVSRIPDDPVQAELVAQLLYEQDSAKNDLRKKGYGCTGMPWRETVAEVPHADCVTSGILKAIDNNATRWAAFDHLVEQAMPIQIVDVMPEMVFQPPRNSFTAKEKS
jgi:hypothetical protein